MRGVADFPAGFEAEVRETIRLVLSTVATTGGIYARIHADGRVLAPAERSEVLDRLWEGARCLRWVDQHPREMAFIAEGSGGRGSTDLSSSVALIRRMQRNLVLMLSDDPRHRAQALTVAEAKVLYRPVVAFIKQYPAS